MSPVSLLSAETGAPALPVPGGKVTGQWAVGRGLPATKGTSSFLLLMSACRSQGCGGDGGPEGQDSQRRLGGHSGPHGARRERGVSTRVQADGGPSGQSTGRSGGGDCPQSVGPSLAGSPGLAAVLRH